ncbi:hypothetical protein R3I93_016869 [Phoxinus phoxinus]|uniref:Immunoglobulin V-set domain-containing protein n=1 Tax=Phoxinus phoxinus TaxID=58324 RepID=A0AAN9CGM4_9TELE
MKNISLFFVFCVFMEGVFGDSVSVTEGKSVTLNTGLSEIKTDEVIEWRFGETLLGRVRKASKPTFDEDALDGKFKGRLTLNNQTGDLTISNIKITDSGEYKVSNKVDLSKTFNVTVSGSGLSPGAIAGIVIAVIAAVGAAVGGVVYGYWKKGQML